MPRLTSLGRTEFVEFDTSIAGVTACLLGRVEVNVVDAQHNPRLKDELYARCRAALDGITTGANGGRGSLRGVTNVGAAVAPFTYAEEPLDTWQAFNIMAERAPGQSIVLDCDCVSPVWAAFYWLRLGEDQGQSQGRYPVGVGVSQPKTRLCCHDASSPCKGAGCQVGPATGKTCRRCGYGMAHAYTVLGMVPWLPERVRRLLVPLPGTHLVEIIDRRGDRRVIRTPAGVFDGSVYAGMPKPRPDFYGSGEASVAWLRPALRDEDVTDEDEGAGDERDEHDEREAA